MVPECHRSGDPECSGRIIVQIFCFYARSFQIVERHFDLMQIKFARFAYLHVPSCSLKQAKTEVFLELTNKTRDGRRIHIAVFGNRCK